jgi:hypothetical protein
MRLKFKRFYRIVVLLIAFLFFLTVVIGSLPIIAYVAY